MTFPRHPGPRSQRGCSERHGPLARMQQLPQATDRDGRSTDLHRLPRVRAPRRQATPPRGIQTSTGRFRSHWPSCRAISEPLRNRVSAASLLAGADVDGELIWLCERNGISPDESFDAELTKVTVHVVVVSAYSGHGPDRRWNLGLDRVGNLGCEATLVSLLHLLVQVTEP
jgi:hypothetical protein